MNIGAIPTQQIDFSVKNSGLRKAAGSPNPPSLSSDEQSMIKNKFSKTKPVTQYTVQGNVKQSSWHACGTNFDRRV
jgi:hypothetical protein